MICSRGCIISPRNFLKTKSFLPLGRLGHRGTATHPMLTYEGLFLKIDYSGQMKAESILLA